MYVVIVSLTWHVLLNQIKEFYDRSLHGKFWRKCYSNSSGFATIHIYHSRKAVLQKENLIVHNPVPSVMLSATRQCCNNNNNNKFQKGQ